MSPDRHLPRWARVLGWIVCLLTYLLAGGVAVGDAFFPSVTIAGAVPEVQVILGTWVLGVMCVIGVLGVVLHRWRLEWVAASVLALLLLARAVPVWVSLDDVPTRLAAACGMTLGALGAGRRALDLWVFHLNTALVARRHRTIERRRATRPTGGRA